MAKNKPGYLPLAMVSDFDEIGLWRYADNKPRMEEQYKVKLPDKRQEFLNDFLSFGSTSLDGYIAKISKELMIAFEKHGYKFPKDDFDKTLSDIKDILVYPLVIEKWSENKQVFKPDDTFVEALLNTKNFSITKSDIEHLPTDTFYIDLEDVAYADIYGGMFVNTTIIDNIVYITFYIITKDYTMFSHYFLFSLDINGRINKKLIDEFMELDDQDDMLVMGANGALFYQEEKKLKSKIKPFDLCKLAMQMICYITSKEPDIEESQKTKMSYRKPTPGTRPKNTFKEVQIHEVGVRYGKSIRAITKKQYKQYKQKQENEVIVNGLSETKQRKRPAPHFRCAHWQRFWTGAGRTVPVNKWIEPVFVGFGNQPKNTDVIIHKVK